ncbi:hypothetical protein HDU96_006111 [Phlyctochytrium bullatum]|nr:hypothetical protein HDU96_006111 [Phlyctochytrium bullatum]
MTRRIIDVARQFDVNLFKKSRENTIFDYATADTLPVLMATPYFTVTKKIIADVAMSGFDDAVLMLWIIRPLAMLKRGFGKLNVVKALHERGGLVICPNAEEPCLLLKALSRYSDNKVEAMEGILALMEGQPCCHLPNDVIWSKAFLVPDVRCIKMLLPFEEHYEDFKDDIDTALEGEDFFPHLHHTIDCGDDARRNNLHCAVCHGMPKLASYLLYELGEYRPSVIRELLKLAITLEKPGVVTALLTYCWPEMLDELNCTNFFLQQTQDLCAYTACDAGGILTRKDKALRAFVDHAEARKRLDVRTIVFNQLNPADPAANGQELLRIHCRMGTESIAVGREAYWHADDKLRAACVASLLTSERVDPLIDNMAAIEMAKITQEWALLNVLMQDPRVKACYQ